MTLPFGRARYCSTILQIHLLAMREKVGHHFVKIVVYVVVVVVVVVVVARRRRGRR